MNIQILPNEQATFNQLPDLCINDVAPALPAASTNNIPYTGTWSPATISTAVAGTATYTFTPTAGQCAFPATMDIITHALTTPQFNPMGQICQYMTNVVIPTTATNTTSYLNGPLITGSWNSPTVVTTSPGTVNYTFTPDPNQCATTLTFPITVDPLIIPQFTQIPQLCQDDANPIFPTTSNNVPGITGSWTPPNIDTSIPGIFTHTFFPDAGQCGDTVDMIITIVPAVPPTFVADTLSGCNPLLVSLSTIGAVQGAQYTWFWNGTTIGTGNTLSYNFDASGYHDITLEYNLLGCIETTTYNDYIYMENYPEASFSCVPGSLTETTMPVQFVNNSVGAISYFWDFDDLTTSTEQNPNHNYVDVTENLLVTLTASTSLGCSDEYQLNIPVIAEPIYYLPNTFTPDEDEHNQTWQAIFTTGFDPHSFHLAVFNRWGELIWETFDATQAWDGTYGPDGHKVPAGIYIWKLQFEPKENDYRKIVSGHLNLIR
jgi:gliding motility-associated-like protein